MGGGFPHGGQALGFLGKLGVDAVALQLLRSDDAPLILNRIGVVLDIAMQFGGGATGVFLVELQLFVQHLAAHLEFHDALLGQLDHRFGLGQGLTPSSGVGLRVGVAGKHGLIAAHGAQGALAHQLGFALTGGLLLQLERRGGWRNDALGRAAGCEFALRAVQAFGDGTVRGDAPALVIRAAVNACLRPGQLGAAGRDHCQDTG